MNVLGDLVARDRRSDHPAFHVAGTGRSVSYHDFCTTAYKAGNVLRYLGVRERATVAVVGTVGHHPVWAFYGAGQLGAVAQFVDGVESVHATPRVLILPVDDEERATPEPSTKLATYGGAPTQPTTLHWEKELWSENPAVHPTDVDPDDPLLSTETETYTHADVLGAARSVVDEFGLDETQHVAVRGPLSQPHVVAAGLVAPILAGGTVVDPTEEVSGDVAVVGSDVDAAPEPQLCRVSDVSL